MSDDGESDGGGGYFQIRPIGITGFFFDLARFEILHRPDLLPFSDPLLIKVIEKIAPIHHRNNVDIFSRPYVTGILTMARDVSIWTHEQIDDSSAQLIPVGETGFSILKRRPCEDEKDPYNLVELVNDSVLNDLEDVYWVIALGKLLRSHYIEGVDIFDNLYQNALMYRLGDAEKNEIN
ncbi:hypothetical protein [Sneathiella glossodoripedis]|uniref:hypothetical protein n=1 Tax=Sneathiella glossodoripedis TaxID=418853 RepID=UPI000470430F|nr:hypothetical protein [Sneathiella glossodoripedis]